MRKLLVLFVLLSVAAFSGGELATASSPAVRATGAWSATVDLGSIRLVPQGQQCVVHSVTTVVYSGTIRGATVPVTTSDTRFFATCDELVVSGPDGIPSVFSAVEHFTGEDGAQATFISFGMTDANGNFKGESLVLGDLNGIIKQVGSRSLGGGTYQGLVVVE
jgi:hypothetical protein